MNLVSSDLLDACCLFVVDYRIWQYLRELVSDGRTTVIITTHYIEEARQADLVRGFL